jgi:hypothetical protein
MLPMWQARDLLTTRVANAIERQLPGRIVGVDVQIKSSGDLMSGEYVILGDDFVVEVTAGKGADKGRQLTRIAADNPTKRIAVYAPHPLFNPIARANLEAIANVVGDARVFDDLTSLIEWVGG